MSLFKAISDRCKQQQPENPDRKLDAIIAITTGWKFSGTLLKQIDQSAHEVQDYLKDRYWWPHWTPPSGVTLPFFVSHGYLPYFTASEDAANLVIPHDYVYTSMIDYELPGRVRLSNTVAGIYVTADAPSPALAKLAATFEALHIEQERKNGGPNTDPD